jgi:hypothetical protein
MKPANFTFWMRPVVRVKPCNITILAIIRPQGKIALALALSGIAATLLDSERTAHFALKLPLNV